MKATRLPRHDTDPYVVALESALSELEDTIERLAVVESEVTTLDERRAQLVAVVDDLLRILPAEDAAAFEKRRSELSQAKTLSRPDDLSDNVVRLFADHHSEKSEWKAAEVVQELERVTGPVDTKAVYNALHYLRRTGRLQQVRRGWYRLASGAAVQLGLDGE